MAPRRIWLALSPPNALSMSALEVPRSRPALGNDKHSKATRFTSAVCGHSHPPLMTHNRLIITPYSPSPPLSLLTVDIKPPHLPQPQLLIRTPLQRPGRFPSRLAPSRWSRRTQRGRKGGTKPASERNTRPSRAHTFPHGIGKLNSKAKSIVSSVTAERRRRPGAPP